MFIIFLVFERDGKMKSYRTIRNGKRRAFSIIELITVMGIIAILIGLLVPALTKVHDVAKNVQQKAQLHSIEVALEMIALPKSDGGLGGYPESDDNFMSGHIFNPLEYCGANKLAEALVGQDYLGVHPNTDFRSNGTFSHPDGSGGMVTDAPVYHAGTPYNPVNILYDETDVQNIDARLGPFIELQNANAYTMEDVWGATNIGNFQPDDGVAGIPYASIVLCDVYTEDRPSGKKTGMPVLYYKANSDALEQDTVTDRGDDFYDHRDNWNLLVLGVPGSTIDHPLSDTVNDFADFDRMIMNPQVTTIDRPYRENSYILVSAGKDGLYGNADDITNLIRQEQ